MPEENQTIINHNYIFTDGTKEESKRGHFKKDVIDYFDRLDRLDRRKSEKVKK